MKSFSAAVILYLSLCSFASVAQNVPTDCKKLMTGRFAYVNLPDPTAYVVRKGSSHMEYMENGRYFIKCKTKWMDKCRYRCVVKKTNLPPGPVTKGMVMDVFVIDETDGLIT